MNTTQPLTYERLANIIAALPPRFPPFHIYYTPFATKEETAARTWKERLLTLPWRPWQKDKLQTHPAIYKVHHHPLGLPGLPISPRRQTITFIVHPAFENAIEKALQERQSQ